jgi:hypothetical protein
LSDLLHQLEFTYSIEYVDYVVRACQSMEIETARRRQPGRLQFEEFLYFMHIFYSLHDAVLTVIEEEFLLILGEPPSNAHVAIMCTFIAWYTHTAELNFEPMRIALTRAAAESRAAKGLPPLPPNPTPVITTPPPSSSSLSTAQAPQVIVTPPPPSPSVTATSTASSVPQSQSHTMSGSQSSATPTATPSPSVTAPSLPSLLTASSSGQPSPLPLPVMPPLLTTQQSLPVYYSAGCRAYMM